MNGEPQRRDSNDRVNEIMSQFKVSLAIVYIIASIPFVEIRQKSYTTFCARAGSTDFNIIKRGEYCITLHKSTKRLDTITSRFCLDD